MPQVALEPTIPVVEQRRKQALSVPYDCRNTQLHYLVIWAVRFNCKITLLWELTGPVFFKLRGILWYCKLSPGFGPAKTTLKHQNSPEIFNTALAVEVTVRRKWSVRHARVFRISWGCRVIGEQSLAVEIKCAACGQNWRRMRGGCRRMRVRGTMRQKDTTPLQLQESQRTQTVVLPICHPSRHGVRIQWTN